MYIALLQYYFFILLELFDVVAVKTSFLDAENLQIRDFVCSHATFASMQIFFSFCFLVIIQVFFLGFP